MTMVCVEHDLMCTQLSGAWCCPSCGDRCRVVPREPPSSAERAPYAVARDLARKLDGFGAHLNARERAFLRVGKLTEETGEAMEALIAWQNLNPRKPAGSFDDVLTELADVALAAFIAIYSLDRDAELVLTRRAGELAERMLGGGLDG
jgi:NTP pyrophosphatase (non-canonical NTP hydrolase)